MSQRRLCPAPPRVSDTDGPGRLPYRQTHRNTTEGELVDTCDHRWTRWWGLVWCGACGQTKPKQDDVFDESTCDRCGRTNHVWHTTPEVWQAVYGPLGQPTRQGVLCPSCFMDDAEEAGVTAPQGTFGWSVTPTR